MWPHLRLLSMKWPVAAIAILGMRRLGNPAMHLISAGLVDQNNPAEFVLQEAAKTWPKFHGHVD